MEKLETTAQKVKYIKLLAVFSLFRYRKCMKKNKYNIAIVGATGVVGGEAIKILEERNFPVDNLRLLASDRSLGKSLSFKGKDIPVDVLGDNSFASIDIAIFSAGKDRSLLYAPKAAKAGAIVIDNSSAFRMENDIPLIVPEVNRNVLSQYTTKNIIANPNCSTIQLVVALKPIHDRFTIKRVVVSTYQSTSGAGLKAMDELSTQSINMFSQKSITQKVFPKRIAFNCIPHIDSFSQENYTLEELKVIYETNKIMNTSFKITCTAVRVPVFYSHAESVNVETEKPCPIEEVINVLKSAEGLEFFDDPKELKYPTQIDATGKDKVFVGRVRRDFSIDHGLNMWVVSDNVRKGAALNAIQIAEELIRNYL